MIAAQPREPRQRRRRRTAPGVAFARPAASCPGGSPRGLRCSTRTRVFKHEKGALPFPGTSGRQGALLPAPFRAGRGCKSPTPDHLPLGFRNPHSRTANRFADTTRPRPDLATRQGRYPYPRTTGPRFACSAKAPACACGWGRCGRASYVSWSVLCTASKVLGNKNGSRDPS